MAWGQATYHFLNQWRPSSLISSCFTRPRWFNHWLIQEWHTRNITLKMWRISGDHGGQFELFRLISEDIFNNGQGNKICWIFSQHPTCWCPLDVRTFANNVMSMFGNQIYLKLLLRGIHSWPCSPLQWRHSERGGVSNHQPLDCLPNQAQIKENIKSPRRWPLWWEFNGNQWIPRTKGQ